MISLCRTTTLTEELGQIQYIFSDKVSSVNTCWLIAKVHYKYSQLPLNGHLVKADTSLKRTPL